MLTVASVTLFERVAGASSGGDLFLQRGKLTTSDKADEDQFGTSVAVSGDTALVGVPGRDDTGSFSGAVYVFTRDANGGWQEGQKLTADDGATGDFFGGSVAISGDITLIGARGNSAQGSLAGAVYVFVRDADGQWSERQKLTASDGAAGNLFGFSVALSGETALVGARGSGGGSGFPGAAYIFAQDANGYWSEVQKLTASDGAAGDEFGLSVALSGDAAFVGARGDDDKGSSSGAVYVFGREADAPWRELQKLTASDGAAGDEFGSSGALDENIALIGAPFAGGVEAHTGAVYVFTFSTGPIGTRWSEVQKLTASDGETEDEFGSSVDLSENMVLVGAHGDDDKGVSSGAAYFFSLTQDTSGNNQWSEHQKLTARAGVAGDEFGDSVALEDTVALIGAPFDDFVDEDDNDEDEDDDQDDDTFMNVGSISVFVQTSSPSACAIRTDYDTASCSGTFLASSLADLDQYVADDFGRKENKGKYQNLTIDAGLEDIVLEIESPCKITFPSRIKLSGDFVRIDGRKGVFSNRGYELAAEKACVLSEQDRAELGRNAIVNAGELTIQAAKTAMIGENSTVDVDGNLIVVSTGNFDSSVAIIDEGAIVTAGSIQLEAPRNAQLADDTLVTADGAVLLVSTGTTSDSKAGVKSRAQVKATDLTISSPRDARIGEKTAITLSGNLTLESTGNASGSYATVAGGAQVTVAGDAEVVSGNKAGLGKKTEVTVTQNLHMEAAKCTVEGSAAVAAGSRSGNCL